MEMIQDEEQWHLGREPVGWDLQEGQGTAGWCLSPKASAVSGEGEEEWDGKRRCFLGERDQPWWGSQSTAPLSLPCWMEGRIKPQSFPPWWFYSAVTGREHIRDEVDHYVLILSAVKQSLLIPNSTIVWHIFCEFLIHPYFPPSVSTNRNCFVVKVNFTLDWIEICLFPF